MNYSKHRKYIWCRLPCFCKLWNKMKYRLIEKKIRNHAGHHVYVYTQIAIFIMNSNSASHISVFLSFFFLHSYLALISAIDSSRTNLLDHWLRKWVTQISFSFFFAIFIYGSDISLSSVRIYAEVMTTFSTLFIYSLLSRWANLIFCAMRPIFSLLRV